MTERNKIYFASDVHLGAPTIANAKEHESKFVRWLESIKDSACGIYLVGDIFDFWFEYKKAIPKGHTRFLGKLCELTDAGIPVYFFTGNHDIWVFDYLPKEMGVIVHREPVVKELDGKRFFIAHGDGLTHFEKSYNRLKSVFTNSFAQWLFRQIHPDLGIRLATFWSRKSRENNQDAENSAYKGEDEWLVIWAKELLKTEHFDYFIFGHRHVAKNVQLSAKSNLVFLGDWIHHFSYGEWDGSKLKIKYFIE